MNGSQPGFGGGADPFIRQYLIYGKTWQRAAIVVTLIAIGAILLAFGILIGIPPVALGVLIGVRMWGPTPLRAGRFHTHSPRPDGHGQD